MDEMEGATAFGYIPLAKARSALQGALGPALDIPLFEAKPSAGRSTGSWLPTRVPVPKVPPV